MPTILISILIGVVIGAFGGPVWILIPWGIIAFAIGKWGKSFKILSGALFGFSVSYTFMIQGYKGAYSLSSRLIPFLLMGLIGTVFGGLVSTCGKKFS